MNLRAYCRMKSMLLTETMKRLENWSVFFSGTKGGQRIFVLKYFYFESNRDIAEKYGYTEREAKI